jgi:hypothetical protein
MPRVSVSTPQIDNATSSRAGADAVADDVVVVRVVAAQRHELLPLLVLYQF